MPQKCLWINLIFDTSIRAVIWNIYICVMRYGLSIVDMHNSSRSIEWLACLNSLLCSLHLSILTTLRVGQYLNLHIYIFWFCWVSARARDACASTLDRSALKFITPTPNTKWLHISDETILLLSIRWLFFFSSFLSRCFLFITAATVAATSTKTTTTTKFNSITAASHSHSHKC